MKLRNTIQAILWIPLFVAGLLYILFGIIELRNYIILDEETVIYEVVSTPMIIAYFTIGGFLTTMVFMNSKKTTFQWKIYLVCVLMSVSPIIFDFL